ncbi:hypothetical protein F5Y09DRAFT_344877 [Xylaria sp. FL1042]|nr:hypothetical protein F5Y09DRAFT_344877 [Xylaria sp. FL1042]
MDASPEKFQDITFASTTESLIISITNTPKLHYSHIYITTSFKSNAQEACNKTPTISPSSSKMLARTTLSTIALLMLTLFGQSNAWLVQFWDTQPHCALDHADTERGGQACQENCSLLGLEDVRTIRISDWDDGCTVSLYNGNSFPCEGDPVWELSKQEAADSGRLVDNNWTCLQDLNGMGIITLSRATEYKAIGTWFESAPSSFDDEAWQRIINADHNPTTSRSVSFQPFKNVFDELEPNSVLLASDWTWRKFLTPYTGSLFLTKVNACSHPTGVNVSEIPVPDAESVNNITDPHIVSLTWDFSWFAGKNLSDILGGNGSEFCWVQLDSSYDLPVNITNTFTDDIASNSTSCVPAFGQACVDAILRNVPGDCDWDSADLNFATIPECAGAFADSVHHNADGEAYLGDALNNSDPAQQPTNGETFYLKLSDPVNGTQSEKFNAVGNGLNVVLLNARIKAQTGYVQGSELLCTRVNTTKLAEKDTNGDGIAYVSEVVLLSGTQRQYSASPSSGCFWTMASLVCVVLYGLM